MEKAEIIQQEVKNGLSDFGLNDEERKDYENIILVQLKDKEFEQEEDLINEVKKNVTSFVPSVKLLQKTRTKIQQEKSELLKQLEQFKKDNSVNKQGNEKKGEEQKTEEMPEYIKVLMQEIDGLKKEREADRKEKIIKDKKEKVLSVVKGKYNKSIHSTIDVLANSVNWETETAENDFKEMLGNLAKDNPFWLVKADGSENENKKNILLNNILKQEDKTRVEEFQKKLV